MIYKHMCIVCVENIVPIFIMGSEAYLYGKKSPFKTFKQKRPEEKFEHSANIKTLKATKDITNEMKETHSVGAAKMLNTFC